MKWKTFEKYLPTDGERILILTTGCGVSAAEGFFFERKSVEKYFKSGLISDNIVQKIRKTEIDIEMTIGYGHNTSYPKYYVVIPIFYEYNEIFYTDVECVSNNFKWIPFPEE